MVPTIVRKILKRAKAATKQSFINAIDPDKVAKVTEKAVRQGAKYIKKNWRTRSGRSLLLETRSRMFPHKKKRARSRSRSAPSAKRGKSSVALVAYNARQGKMAGTIRGRFRRTRSFSTRARSRSLMLHRAAKVLLTEMAKQNPYVMRRQGDAVLSVTYNERNFYTGRLYNWYCEHNNDGGAGDIGFYRDFGSSSGTAPTVTPGFLGSMQQYDVRTAANEGANMRLVNMYNHKWRPDFDPDQQVYMWPCKALYHWKNNSGLQVTMHFYVVKVLQDIRWNTASSLPDPSPKQAWFNSLAGGASLGMSNLATEADLNTQLLAYPSDNKRNIHPYYKFMSHKKFVLQPGDEAKQSVVQPARRLSMMNIYQRQIQLNGETAPAVSSIQNGFWALKGELITFTILQGGMVTLRDAGGAARGAGFAELDSAVASVVDLVVTKEFKGVVLPQVGVKRFEYYDDKTAFVATNTQIQTLPSFVDTS